MIRLRTDRQANRIEKALKHHGIPLRVKRVDVGPRWTIFHAVIPLGHTVNRIARLAEEIAMSLGTAACRVTRDGPFVNIKVPRDDDVVDVNLLSYLDEVRGIGIVTPFLGLDEIGNPLYVRLNSDLVSHILVAGITGSGKTELTRAMIVSCAVQASVADVGLILIDPKMRGYGIFRGLPHLCRDVAGTIPAALDVLRWAVTLMENRDREGQSSPKIVIFIDEVADLILQASEVTVLLTRLLQRGRQSGIHIVACTQKPTTSVIGSLTKSNFPVRIVGRVASPEDAKVASGLKQTGAEKLQGRGDFLLITSEGIVGFQGVHVSEQAISEIILGLRGGKPVSQQVSSDDGVIVVGPESWVNQRSAGRPQRPPTDDEIQSVLAFWSENGKPPSLRWIRRQFNTRNDRARRIYDAARVVRNGTVSRVSGEKP